MFQELYPNELKHYEKTVFVHYAQGTTAIEGNPITTRQAEELFERSIEEAPLIMRNLSVSFGEYRRIQVYVEKAEYVPPPPFEIFPYDGFKNSH
jgi:hypothetical protein